MTGFGRATATHHAVQVSVELSGVNRKQADLALSLPPELQPHESTLRKTLLAAFSRGRLTAQIRFSSVQKAETLFDFEKALALEHSCQQLSERLGRQITPEVSDFLSLPRKALGSDCPPELLLELTQRALEEALRAFLTMREQEGAELRFDLIKRLENLFTCVESITQLAPHRRRQYHTTLLQRLAELDVTVADSEQDERIAKEIALFVDRSDISEELTRLKSHHTQFHRYLQQDEAVGRSLDFLCQEIHRELNTIASKASDAPIAHLIVESKTILETIREQVQNIE